MKKSAFTLIELLVVIAIIAILVGIAIPVFSKVMERGRVTQDASNLRQLGLATVGYLNDNDDQMFATNATGQSNSWPNSLNPKYVQGWGVFHSPFDPRAEGSNTVSYGVNSKVMGTFTGKYTNTSALVLMAPNVTTDSLDAPASWPGTSANNPTISPTAGAATPAGTHASRERINVLFSDSHIDNVKWESFTNTNATNTKVTWVPFAP